MLKTVKVPEYWQKPLIVLLLLLGVYIGAYTDSWFSVVKIWLRSETYAHGFFVLPASLWLIWGQRERLKQIRPRPSYLALLFLLGSGFVWLVAVLAKVLVVEQFALVAMLIAIVWAVLGNQLTSNLLFPLLFLFLMVPFGEDFVPYLMEYTATFVVAALRLTGLSVYREGLHFTLTSGHWSVVEACSGIRYLIASFTLGLIYAYINYATYLKRVIFILLSVLVPILANGLRAYMIVMIGHLSGMKLATGVDHIIYGWLFFGLVMMVLFYVGSFWVDPVASASERDTAICSTPTAGRSLIMPAMLTLLCIVIWPVAETELQSRQHVQASIPSYLNASRFIEADDPHWGWRPEFNGTLAESLRFVHVGDRLVGVYFANFGDESLGGELINSQNVLISPRDEVWRDIDSRTLELPFSPQAVSVEQTTLDSQWRDLLVLRWYRIGAVNTANPYYAKWLQLIKRLTGDASPELMVVLYTQSSRDEYDLAIASLEKVALACCDQALSKLVIR